MKSKCCKKYKKKKKKECKKCPRLLMQESKDITLKINLYV